jgi:hypothetical protein
MTKKNFYIVRYYLNDEVQFATSLTRSQSRQYLQYTENIHHNEAGGLTIWYRMDIQPSNK